MRYTTLIDITEYPSIWRNNNAIKLYVYMTLKCGYHDDDRDMIKAGYRTLAAATGMTTEACRHALKMLQREGLLSRDGDSWRVTKFVLERKITKRALKSVGVIETDEEARQKQEAKEAAERTKEEKYNAIRKDLTSRTDEELMHMLATIDAGKEIEAAGMRLAADDGWKKSIKAILIGRKLVEKDKAKQNQKTKK